MFHKNIKLALAFLTIVLVGSRILARQYWQRNRYFIPNRNVYLIVFQK